MTIQRLSKLTVGQIAAGEVIERPAAVVKELVENALDAGARRIDVSIAGGGTELIEVRDDGAGIPFDELQLAVERHTTSKLSEIDDLSRLVTLGFRGEALASIAAVSDLRIQSVACGSGSGGEIRVRYGEIIPPKQIAWGGGTSVSASNIFANVPARKQFLRKPGTETGYVARVVGAYALAYPGVAFSFRSDGNQAFATDGRGDMLNAAVAVWGKDVAQQMVTIDPLEHDHPGYDVGGIISLPGLDRATRQRQFLFAQGRLIQSRQLAAAFEQAYHTLLMVGRHPVGCLLLNVPADRIDVNVHPTKSEVRFADERIVFALVQRAVRTTLLEQTGQQRIPTVVTSPLAPATHVDSRENPSVQRRLRLANPDRNPAAAPERETGPDREASLDEPAPVSAGGRSLPVLRVLGQISGMFVIAEGPGGLYLIDQHAAHERVLFEQVMAEYESRSPASQTLLTPAVVELSPQQQQMYEQCRDDLTGFGFETEEFGSSSVAVRAVPAILQVRDAGESLLTILDELIEGGRGDSRLESLAISAACHSSIRAGQPLSLLEMRELVSQLESCSSPLACGHGRPTMIHMTAAELERQFSRR